jgi:uncharacterized protein YecE (DUF72 family)
VKAFVGVSGFSYASWKGTFYPKETKNEDLLVEYTKRLGTVEVNSSFYAPPRDVVVKGWAGKTEEKFRFAFKAPRLVTHILKLGNGSAESAAKFSKTLDLLGPRRGPVLFQLPPFLKVDLKLLEDFLSKTSAIEPKVFEFRHESWLNDSTYRALDKSGAGFCIAETEDLKPVLKVTGPLAYFRLRKDSYDQAAMDRWAEKIRKTSAGSKESFVYLRHDETGENAVLAQNLSGKLGS